MSNSAIAIGVDGCRGGWFFARQRHSGNIDFGVVEKLDTLLDQHPGPLRIGLDMPIGLRERSGEPRRCDRDARRLLGARRSSVFSPPLRGALGRANHAAASAWQKQRCGKGLSIQAFNIGAKIAQVDSLLAARTDARRALIEVHPELCFYGLNEARPVLSSKKTATGAQERTDLLKLQLPNVARLLDDASKRYLRKDVARDDILDAMAALVAVRAPATQTLSLPQVAQNDARGLPMRIMFYLPAAYHRQVREQLA